MERWVSWQLPKQRVLSKDERPTNHVIASFPQQYRWLLYQIKAPGGANSKYKIRYLTAGRNSAGRTTTEREQIAIYSINQA